MRILLVIMLLWCSMALADPLPKDRVIMAMIGEAESGGLDGLRCVASAINNRGTLKGVYGEHSSRVRKHKYSPRTFVLAVQAYEDALKHDYSNGSTHWEGISFKTPYWANGMTEVMICGGNRFFKERTK